MFASQVAMSFLMIFLNVKITHSESNHEDPLTLFEAWVKYASGNKVLLGITAGFVMNFGLYVGLSYLYSYSEILGSDQMWYAVESCTWVCYAINGYLSCAFAHRFKKSRLKKRKKMQKGTPGIVIRAAADTFSSEDDTTMSKSKPSFISAAASQNMLNDGRKSNTNLGDSTKRSNANLGESSGRSMLSESGRNNLLGNSLRMDSMKRAK